MNKDVATRFGLSFRLALFIFLAEGALLAAFSVLIYRSVRTSSVDAFDQTVRANAEALASLVELDDQADQPDEDDREQIGGLEIAFADETMRSFSRKRQPDLFAIMEDRTVLRKSDRLVNIPEPAWKQNGEAAFFDHKFNGETYRGIVLSTIRLSSSDPNDYRRIRVFFSRSRADLDARLHSQGVTILTLCILCLVITGLLARLIATAGLRPLARLAREIRGIREDRLHGRISPDGLSSDLMPIAQSVNNLLERLENAFETERRFSADAAHELRTPLATLKSGIQAALLKSAENPAAKRVLEPVLNDVERIEHLCDALLLLTRGETARTSPGMSFADWLEEIEIALDCIRNAPATNGATFHMEVQGPNLPDASVKSDSASTFQIVTNLLDNAVRHGGGQVDVRVRVSWNDSRASLAVEDNGAGVPPGCEPHLFDRFYRAESSRSRATGGYGLGLSICKALAESMDGTLAYESNKPRGSRFLWSVSLDTTATQ